MIVVHPIEVSTLYPRVVISSPVGDWRTSFLLLFTSPSVCGPEITRCRYKGLLQEYVMLCYGFPNKRSPLAVLRFPAQTSPLAPCGFGSSQSMSQRLITKYGAIPTQPSMTQPIVFLISKQAIPYRTHGGTCCPGVSTPKIRSIADSSMTNHIT
jgi:hypothetical protein